MCCKDITDVYQLLKASGICKEDLMCHNLPIFVANDVNGSEANEDGSQTNAINQYLVFKKWHDIHPGTEFRCFVRNKRIVGISPRDWPQYHEYICSQKINIINDIVTMFREQVKPKFPLFDCKWAAVGCNISNTMSAHCQFAPCLRTVHFRYFRCCARYQRPCLLNRFRSVQ